MHVKNDYSHREGDRYTTLEQLQLTLSLESSAKEPVEEAERPASSSVRFDCTCFLLPCSSADRCLSAKNKSPGPKNTHELPTLHAALADAAEKDVSQRHESLARIEELIDQLDTRDVDVRDQRGETALTCVKVLLRRGHFGLACQTAGLLLGRGADVDAEDCSHQTLLSHSVAYLDQTVELTRLLLNHGAQVWHGTDYSNSRTGGRGYHYVESPFSTFLQAVVRVRCVDGAVMTASLLGRMMGSRPEAMRSLVVRSMLRHGRCVRVLGPVFVQLKSLLSPYWRQPHRLSYAAWNVVRRSMNPPRLVTELEQLGLPPALHRFIIMDD